MEQMEKIKNEIIEKEKQLNNEIIGKPTKIRIYIVAIKNSDHNNKKQTKK